jgi:hypothetical protein
MILIIIGGIGALVGVLSAMAIWQLVCWGLRLVLGIPQHLPVFKRQARPLPYYLDDRIPSRNIPAGRWRYDVTTPLD